MKKFLSLFIFLVLAMASVHAATLVGTPSINFGTATYKSGGKGLITITVKTNPNSAINTVTTSGSGYIYNWQGNYEEIPVQFSGMNKKTNRYLYFRLQGTDYEISTPGCGKIELSNVGGTLNINANQDAGDYTGSYLVSLTY